MGAAVESLWFGVPTAAISQAVDQFVNETTLEAIGAGVYLPISQLSTQTLRAAVQKAQSTAARARTLAPSATTPQCRRVPTIGLDSEYDHRSGYWHDRESGHLPARHDPRPRAEHARRTGTTLSGLVDAALRAELTRHELADHMAMLAQADDPDRLRQRARARAEALASRPAPATGPALMPPKPTTAWCSPTG